MLSVPLKEMSYLYSDGLTVRKCCCIIPNTFPWQAGTNSIRRRAFVKNRTQQALSVPSVPNQLATHPAKRKKKTVAKCKKKNNDNFRMSGFFMEGAADSQPPRDTFRRLHHTHTHEFSLENSPRVKRMGVFVPSKTKSWTTKS